MQMILEDVIYFASLVMCIAVGQYYKSIEDEQMKKSYGAGLGLLVVCLVCRQYFLHTFLMVLGNIAIIKCCDKRYMHQLSLAYTWIYLLYLDYSLDVSDYVIFIYQGLALRLVGLAFELRIPEKSRTSLTDGRKRSSIVPKGTSTTKLVSQVDVSAIGGSEPSSLDILTYAYFFVGLHKGPYYRLNIFNDYFELPFSALGDCRAVTKEKLRNVAMCTLAYVLLSVKFPLRAYESEDFYKKCGSDYRFFYNVPQLMIFCLHHQIIMTLCTCVFTETGFGVYPSRWNPIPGIGPSTRVSSAKLNENDTVPIANPQEVEYNFSMLKCFDNETLLEGPMMKNTMRAWDMPTQYWFWAYIYKSLLKANKEVRSACSFFMWSVWIGPTLSHVLFSITIWIYLNLENEYDTLYNTRHSLKYAWNFGYSIMRLLFLVYLTPCLVLDNSPTVFRYYMSIYWSFHVILFGLVLSAIAAYKIRAPASVNN